MSEVPCKVRTLYQFGEGLPRITVEFVKLDKPLPSYTHRVVVEGLAFDWLGSEYRPSRRTARFFYDKYMAGQEAKV